jgi:hypothetical protein
MAKMRSMVVRERGGRFVAEERDIPIPGPEEMRIRVQACGVCHSDVVTVQGLFPIVQYPRVPGHEVIGVVDALGEGVHGWKVGARAGVGWFGGSCGYCRQCRRDNAFVCENVHEISGVTRDGGYATHMTARVSAVSMCPTTSTRSSRRRCFAPASPPPTRSVIPGPAPATSSPFVASAALGIWESSSRRGRASHSRGQPRPRQGGARPQARR